jgi:hypothetical protein
MEQLLPWLVLILPWFLLLPLDFKRVRRFVPVTLFWFFCGSIIFQMAGVFDWWTITNNVFFLTFIPSFAYGFIPVVTIFVFHFFYPNVWLYFSINFLLDAVQAFVISPLIFERYLYELTIPNAGLFLIIFSLAPVIYLFQRWYESAIHEYNDVRDGVSKSLAMPEFTIRWPRWLRRRVHSK